MTDTHSDDPILHSQPTHILSPIRPQVSTTISKRSKKIKKQTTPFNSSQNQTHDGNYIDKNGNERKITFVISEKEAQFSRPTLKFSEIVKALAETYKKTSLKTQTDLISANFQETSKVSVNKNFSPSTNDPRSFVEGNVNQIRTNIFLSSVEDV